MNCAANSSMQNWHQQVSRGNAFPKDCIQQRTPTDINIHPSGSDQAGLGNKGSKNCSITQRLHFELPPNPALNLQPNVLNADKMQDCVPLKKRKQYLTVTDDNPGFTAKHIVSTENQMLNTDVSFPKRTLDNGIRPFTKHFDKGHVVTRSICGRNVAVVFPLGLGDVESNVSSKNPPNVNKEHHKTSSVANDPYPQHALLQSRARKNDSCSTSCTVAQTNPGSPSVPTVHIPDSGFSKCSEPEGPIQTKDISHQRESLYSESLQLTVQRVCMRKEKVQSLNMDNQYSTGILPDVTTTNKSNISGSKSKSNTDNKKWSLQRLHRLIWDMEKRQNMSWKEVPSTDLTNDILRLFWDGDFQKLWETVRSDHYANIMKEVKLYHGKRDSIILQERSKEELDHGAEDIQNAKQNPVPPTVMLDSFQSLVLNSNKELSDSKHGELTFFKNLQITAKVSNDEIRMKHYGNAKEFENKKTSSTEASSKTGAFSQVQSQPMMTLQKLNCRNIEDGVKMSTGDLTDMDIERIAAFLNRKKHVFESLSKLPSTESLENSTNVTVNSERVERENKTIRNVVSLAMSLNEDSPAESDLHSCNAGKAQPTTETTRMDECNNADSIDDCSFVKMSVLSPETAKKMYFLELNEEVETKHKDVFIEICTKKTDRAIIDQCDQMPADDSWTNTNMKPAENNIDNDGAHQLEKYCCLATWFHVLGYARNSPCKCEKNTDGRMMEETSTILSDASSDDLEIMEVVTNYEDVRKIANAMSVQQIDKLLTRSGPHAFKKGKHSNDAFKRKRTNHTSCGQFVTKFDLSSPLTPTDLDLHIKEKNISKTPEAQKVHKKERMVNLALFGSSIMKHNREVGVAMNKKKRVFGVRSFDTDTEHFPPATLNVRVNPLVRLNDTVPNVRQTAKQRVLKSWQTNSVPIQMFAGKKRSRKLRTGFESRTETEDISGTEMSTFSTAFDAMKNLLLNQQHSLTHESEISSPAVQHKSAVQSKKKKHFAKRDLMKKRKLDSINLTSRRRGQNAHRGKSSASSVQLPCTLSRNKNPRDQKSKRSTLDYRVLPETFSFRDGSISKKVHQSSGNAYGEQTEAERPKKTQRRAPSNLGVWCVSPEKKGHIKSSLPSSATGSASTFQEFKKRYEEKTNLRPKTT